jgi:hypothetical protein
MELEDAIQEALEKIKNVLNGLSLGHYFEGVRYSDNKGRGQG